MQATQTDKSASPASADAGTHRPFTFRLPIAGGHMGYGTERTWQAHSACGQYEISFHLNHGNRKPGITHWGFETRIDSAGHNWTNTDSNFVTDNFGNLIEVAA